MEYMEYPMEHPVELYGILNEIYEIYGDNSDAKKKLDWQYDLSFYDVLDVLIKEEIENYK